MATTANKPILPPLIIQPNQNFVSPKSQIEEYSPHTPPAIAGRTSVRKRQKERRNSAMPFQEIKINSISPGSSTSRIASVNVLQSGAAFHSNSVHYCIDTILTLLLNVPKNYVYKYDCNQNNKTYASGGFVNAVKEIYQIVLENKQIIPIEVIKEIFRVYEKHIIHKIPDIGSTLVIGENFSKYDLTDWNVLSNIYSCLILLSNRIATFITAKKIYDMSYMIQSPVKYERYSMLELIRQIFQNSTHNRMTIFLSLIDCINSFNENQALPFCVSPCFEFFYSFYSNLLNANKSFNQSLNPSYITLFKKNFYPLIRHDFVSEYYKSALPLFYLFQNSFSDLPLWCVKQLFKYWPIKSSHKQIIFLHQFQQLAPKIVNDFAKNPYISYNFLSKLASCIKSHNLKVAISAIGICREESFQKIFQIYFNYFKSSIYPAIQYTASNHWAEEVRNMAKMINCTFGNMDAATIQSIAKSLSGDLPKAIRTSRSERLYNGIKYLDMEEEQKIECWITIAQHASKYYKDLDSKKVITMIKEYNFTES